VDILITIDGFHTLMDIVIANLIRTNMVQQASMMTTHATMMVVQENTWSYAEQSPSDDFIPFTIEIYGCLLSCFDSFFTTCTKHVHKTLSHVINDLL
jgi:hypothetical protein